MNKTLENALMEHLERSERQKRPRRGPVKRGGRKGKWGYDLWLRDPETGRKTIRIRSFEFETKGEADVAVAAILLSDRDAKYGLQPARFEPLLSDLIAKRLPLIEIQQERRRSARVLGDWLALLPAGIRIEQIHTTDIQLYVDRRRKDGVSAATIDRELNMICATLNAARDLFPSLSQWITPKIPRPKVPRTRRERLITDEEYRLILSHLQRQRTPEERQPAYQARIRTANLLRFALLTGMRPGEIFELRWDDLDKTGGRIRVRATKTEHRGNSTRYLPLTPSILQILRERKAAGESTEYVFSLSGSRPAKEFELLQEACEVNGIPWGRDVENGFELYCARHTFTTQLLLEGLSLSEVGAITGHSDRELVLYYSHVTPESAARAAAKLEQIEARRLRGCIEEISTTQS